MRRWMRREAERRQVAWTRQVDSSERWKRANNHLVRMYWWSSRKEKRKWGEGGGQQVGWEMIRKVGLSARRGQMVCYLVEASLEGWCLKWAGEVINWIVQGKVQRTWLVLQSNLIDLRLRWAGIDPAGTWWWCGEDGGLIFYFVQMYPTIYELLLKEQIEQGCRWERIDKPWWENGRCKRGVEILILMMGIGMGNGCKE